MRRAILAVVALTCLVAAGQWTVGLFPVYAVDVWDDLMVDAENAKLPASGAPGLETFVGGTVKALAFDASADECVHFSAQLPHGYKVGTALYPHIHTTPTDTGAGTVLWYLDCVIGAIGGVMTAESTNTASVTQNGTAWRHQVTPFANLVTCAGCGISTVLVCTLCRDGNGSIGTDSYAADAALIGIDFHHLIDSPGSSSESAK